MCDRPPTKAADLAAENDKLRAENLRLREGRFSSAEFQNLCHTFSETDRQAFCTGCENYQHKLFGQSPITKLRDESNEWHLKYERAEAGRLGAIENLKFMQKIVDEARKVTRMGE